jgi:putative transposase
MRELLRKYTKAAQGPEWAQQESGGGTSDSARAVIAQMYRVLGGQPPGEEIAAELEVSPATLYNWRRTYGGMDVDAAKELKELREQNSRLKRLLAEAELEKDALREVAKGKF